VAPRTLLAATPSLPSPWRAGGGVVGGVCAVRAATAEESGRLVGFRWCALRDALARSSGWRAWGHQSRVIL